MKEHLNTLFVTTQGAYLGKEDEAVLVRVEEQVRLRVPIHTLAGIVCFGHVGCSPALMYLCGERGVTVSFLSERGKFLGRVEGPVGGNVLLRREQYRRADDEASAVGIARALVSAKIANARAVLRRGSRDRGPETVVCRLGKAADALNLRLGALEAAGDLDAIRGIEGDSARVYFEVFDDLIAAQKDHFVFRARTRRPPLDAVNSLLSFVYALLEHDVRSALAAVGLDPAVGFLHRDRPGRPGLSLDLMEEFRPFFADRLVLSLINLRQVQAPGFRTEPVGGVMMDDATRKVVLTSYQKRKQEQLLHPFLNERMTLGMLFHIQARLFARFLRGDLDGYPPFVWR